MILTVADIWHFSNFEEQLPCKLPLYEVTHGFLIIWTMSNPKIHAVIDSLYFVPHISHIFSTKNSLFDLKVTPSWHFGISHHYLVENVLIVIDETKSVVIWQPNVHQLVASLLLGYFSRTNLAHMQTFALRLHNDWAEENYSILLFFYFWIVA